MPRVAVWGLGPHAFKNVIPAISASPGFELIGVCSRNRASRDAAVGTSDIRSWAEPAEMLRSDLVDIVYLATPTGLHFSHGMQVLEARKHLVCEKSLTGNTEHSFRLVEYSAKADLLLCEAFAFQYHPRFLAAQEVLTNDGFGRILHASCCFGLPPLDHPGFRMTAALGGGALLDVGGYPLAAMRVLLGDAGSVVHARIYRSNQTEVDVRGSASLEFAGNIPADVAWWYNGAYAADLIVYGERESLCVNRLFSKETVADSKLVVRSINGSARTMTVPAANAFVKMFEVVNAALTDRALRDRLRGEVRAQASLMNEVTQCAR